MFTCLHILKWVGSSTKRFVFFLGFIYLIILFLHTCMFPACCFRQRTYMAQGLVNGVFNSSLKFEWFSVGYGFILRSLLPFSKSVFTLVWITRHMPLIFDIFFRCVCVCVCVWEREREREREREKEWFRILLKLFFLCMCVNMCLAIIIFIEH